MTGADQAATPPTKKYTLVSEFYDEIVFQEPTSLTLSLLNSVTLLTEGVWRHEVDFEDKKRTTVVTLDEARKKVKDEITDLKDKLTLARETIDSFKAALVNAHQKSPTHSHHGGSSPRKSGSFSSEPIAGTSRSSYEVEDMKPTLPPPVSSG